MKKKKPNNSTVDIGKDGGRQFTEEQTGLPTIT